MAIQLFGKVLSKWLQASMDISLRHAGFMKNRGTYDHLFTLESTTTLAQDAHSPINAAFLNLSKTFETVSHTPIGRVLEDKGVDPHVQGLLL